MTKHGETDDMKGEEFIKIIEKHLGRKITLVLANNQLPEKEVVDKYKKEGSESIQISKERKNISKRDLLSPGDLARHDIGKLKGVLKEILV